MENFIETIDKYYSTGKYTEIKDFKKMIKKLKNMVDVQGDSLIQCCYQKFIEDYENLDRRGVIFLYNYDNLEKDDNEMLIFICAYQDIINFIILEREQIIERLIKGIMYDETSHSYIIHVDEGSMNEIYDLNPIEYEYEYNNLFETYDKEFKCHLYNFITIEQEFYRETFNRSDLRMSLQSAVDVYESTFNQIECPICLEEKNGFKCTNNSKHFSFCGDCCEEIYLRNSKIRCPICREYFMGYENPIENQNEIQRERN